jgi:P-type Ca2+ transporter type 2C
MEWYQKSSEEIICELNSSMNGLKDEQVLESKTKYGSNELESEDKESIISIFLSQYKDLLVVVLIVAGIISACTGELVSSIVIFVVITINAILGTIQTVRAQKSLDSLKKLSLPNVKVIQNGNLIQIPSTELVVGDVVSVEAGDIIEGDGRILECFNLQVNESALTGESLAQDKMKDVILEECGISDQKNMVFSSSLVTNGTGKYIVTSVGMNTQIGKIASMLQNAQERKTPLQVSLDDFSKKLTISICAICLIIMCMNIFMAHEDIVSALLIAVALAVAAIPEALGSIVTIVLSISTQKMVKEHAIIKQLNAVESLGCVSVICSDKTGTLTQNKMTVTDMYLNLEHINTLNLSDHCHEVLLKICALCTNATETIGDPTEIALVDLYNKYSYDLKSERMLELPFDSVRKLMSVSSQNHIYTKGAVDELLKICDTILIHDEIRELTEADKELILSENENYAKQGLRVLGFAYKKFNEDMLDFKDESNLTFVGMVSQMDPPRKESEMAVAQCKQAGIKPIMITGDHVITARAIAEKIGIYKNGDICLSGNELEKMSEEQLDEILSQVSVYARVAPEHKIRIVKAWQKRGDIVAMTGDGVNDAPALKQSDIGVAMGITGTEVSKDAASMILTDDNFATIVKAVITGRNVYSNIKNAITYLLSGNFSAILAVVFCSVLLLPNPFMAVHLLFINLITDSLPAIAIGMEKGSDEVLNEKPRNSKDSILNKRTLIKIGYEGCIIFIFVMIAYFLGLQTSPLMASTMAFSTLCLSRLLHGFSSRTSKRIYKVKKNTYSIFAFLIGFILLTCILLIPSLHGLFSIGKITINQYLLVCACALASFLSIQITKKAND